MGEEFVRAFQDDPRGHLTLGNNGCRFLGNDVLASTQRRVYDPGQVDPPNVENAGLRMES